MKFYLNNKIYKLRLILVRSLNSPTLMTYCSFASKSLTFFIVIPLIIIKLDSTEVVLWLLYNTLFSFQSIADLGLSPSFSRVIAYSMAGANYAQLDGYSSKYTKKVKLSGTPDWSSIQRIYSTMRTINTMITIGFTILLLILGTIAVKKPISQLPDELEGWTSWIIVVFSFGVVLYGNAYSALLQGTNRVALLRRWETIIALVAITSNCAILILNFGFLLLVFSNYFWICIYTLKNHFIYSKIKQQYFQKKRTKFEKRVFRSIWKSAWRSSLGSFLNLGLIQISSIFYAQQSNSQPVVSYLLALKVIQMIKNFSLAPFYSKIPLLARLKAEGKDYELIKIAKRGMTLSYLSFIIPYLLIGLSYTVLLDFLGKSELIIPKSLWFLLGLAFFLERFSAMHFQLYSLTNKVIWHIASAISGIIFVILSALLFRHIGVFAYPVALSVGYSCFSVWYAAKNSYLEINSNFWNFEIGVSIIPLISILVFGIYSLV